MSSERKKAKQLAITEFEWISYYENRLMNLALSQFEWHNLPDTVDRWYMEWALFTRGSVAFYKPRGTDFWACTGWVQGGGRGSQFDAYNYPMGIVGQDAMGRQHYTDEFYLIYDNMTRVNVFPQINMYARRLAHLELTFNSNLMQQNTPYIITAQKADLVSVNELFRKVFSFEPVISLRANYDTGKQLIETLKTIDLKVPFIGKDLMEVKQAVWADAISMLGIAPETAKKERMLSDEISLNRQEDTISLNARLMQRVEFCNKFNKKNGTDISVNLYETGLNDDALKTDDTDKSVAREE